MKLIDFLIGDINTEPIKSNLSYYEYFLHRLGNVSALDVFKSTDFKIQDIVDVLIDIKTNVSFDDFNRFFTGYTEEQCKEIYYNADSVTLAEILYQQLTELDNQNNYKIDILGSSPEEMVKFVKIYKKKYGVSFDLDSIHDIDSLGNGVYTFTGKYEKLLNFITNEFGDDETVDINDIEKIDNNLLDTKNKLINDSDLSDEWKEFLIADENDDLDNIEIDDLEEMILLIKTTNDDVIEKWSR